MKRVAGETPIVLCPSHKSYVDFLVLSWVFYQNGLTPPHVAAGINLSFWPFGAIARHGGGFFIRRSLRGDRVYTAVLRAYVKQLLRNRYPQEFYLEGGRSRTGKLLFPKTGLFSMEVDAWLEGRARTSSSCQSPSTTSASSRAAATRASWPGAKRTRRTSVGSSERARCWGSTTAG